MKLLRFVAAILMFPGMLILLAIIATLWSMDDNPDWEMFGKEVKRMSILKWLRMQ